MISLIVIVIRKVVKYDIVILQLMAVIFGLIYWRQPLNQMSITNINGCLYSMLSQMTFGFCFNVILV